MYTVTIEPRFEDWRGVARAMLAAGISPAELHWQIVGDAEMALFAEQPPEVENPIRYDVPKAFFPLAKAVSCHRSNQQWHLLYTVLWNLTHGKDAGLLDNATDDAVGALLAMQKEVRRDIHKMRAFVRFRQVQPLDPERPRECFVAWFEPDHRIVYANAPFFRKRFAGMDWSILTPDDCVHWHGEQLTFTEGVSRKEGPKADDLEALWRGYYRSIFNPARVKLKAMQAEMPKKYWKNLPEAEVIDSLIRHSAPRVAHMMDTEQRPIKPITKNAYLRQLDALGETDSPEV